MLFWLMIIVTIIVFGICIWSFFDDTCVFSLSLCVILSAIMLVVIVVNYATADADEARFEQEYESLVYKCETDNAKDEFGFLNKEYIDDIEQWNTELAFNKNICRNFWVGIFIPNIYDELEYINYNDIRFK